MPISKKSQVILKKKGHCTVDSVFFATFKVVSKNRWSHLEPAAFCRSLTKACHRAAPDIQFLQNKMPELNIVSCFSKWKTRIKCRFALLKSLCKSQENIFHFSHFFALIGTLLGTYYYKHSNAKIDYRVNSCLIYIFFVKCQPVF